GSPAGRTGDRYDEAPAHGPKGADPGRAEGARRGIAMIFKLIQQMGYTLISIAKGMSVTWRNLFRTKQTIQFPTAQLVLPPIYRGGLNFEEEKCIVCELCEKACPVPGSRTEKTIEIFFHVEKKRELDEFYIDYSTCINCYLCVDACP